MPRVRSAVCSRKELWVSADSGLHESFSMFFALQDRQAEHVRAQSLVEDRVPIVEHMMRSNRSTDALSTSAHKLDGILCGDVLHDDFQFRRKLLHQRLHDFLDEHLLAVKEINIGSVDLPMDQKGHADLSHCFQSRVHVLDVGNAAVRVCGHPFRVQLHGVYMSGRFRLLDDLGGGLVSQVQCHQRSETLSFRQRTQDAIPISEGLLAVCDWRNEVRHDDGTFDPLHLFQAAACHFPVPQM
mmetsp:Transcript_17789/g.43532  ORF Transcript_17789/g.43532 Transcript_17789/m.43532 type:complete len:241 (-) Transcript_17789:162-884(-)